MIEYSRGNFDGSSAGISSTPDIKTRPFAAMTMPSSGKMPMWPPKSTQNAAKKAPEHSPEHAQVLYQRRIRRSGSPASGIPAGISCQKSSRELSADQRRRSTTQLYSTAVLCGCVSLRPPRDVVSDEGYCTTTSQLIRS